MSEWTVAVGVDTHEHLAEEVLFALGQAAEQWDATVGARGDSGPGFLLIVDIAAPDPISAGADAVGMASELAEQVGVAHRIVQVDVKTPELAELAALRPDVPELLATTDVAEALGVSRQRVHQLAADHPQFPEPFVRLGAGPVWTRPAIEHFATLWARKPGRPAKAS